MQTKNTTHNARMIFARNLKEFRSKNRLSQEELADMAGLHRTYVGSVERGERNISIDNIERLASALKINIKELLNDE
ncbi:helix-turn-helix domain-containing protein [Methylococcus sp. EFPC2]|uniref:helix-turn-helix domain-containing protein n=1 Tax=Methylococcus sp. EFPC2 TaxID=2812648 RepID=UPI0019670F80|nr:helix-turn-helix transcriptional regulator [Methylococcus sp. EFPC2]QSA97839.1 helix-turn-helix transcriptional regulator [Methylococcus sp. EFPC2]